ncbi:MAG: DUF2892 domain-containing protein [Rhodothermaceae bacterium]
MIEMYIRRMAGVFILTGMALGHYVNNLWFLLVVFVGLNLIQSSFTRWCPAEIMLKKIFKNKDA